MHEASSSEKTASAGGPGALAGTGLLPPVVAEQVDTLYAALDQSGYYALLGVAVTADRRAIQQAYHGLALTLHPDRHARLKRSHPDAYRRINQVFKRLAEGYRVLMDTESRRRYNVALRSRGETRHSPNTSSPREQKELDLCQTDVARQAVLESQEARSFGRWQVAYECVSRAVAAEPDNRPLGLLADAIRKFVTIINR